jgi:ferredoxin--NADP+ reductase/benzoate/toluate 1,2-dioxygenase reductase subunit
VRNNNNGKSLRVTDYLRQNRISKDSMVYLCGNRNMIIDSVQILLDQGIGGDQIVSEVFF